MLRFRSALIMTACLLACAAAMVVVPPSWARLAGPMALVPPENACVAPGLTVQTDASADQLGATNANQQLDIQSVKIAEPFTTTSDHNLTFTMKVDNLNGTIQPNSTWQINFDVPDTSGTSRTLLVTMNTTDLPGSVSFNYGYSDGGFDTSQCVLGTCDLATGSYTTDGTITIKLNTGATLSFSDVNGNHVFDANVSQAGINLSAITGHTTLLIGALGTGAIQAVDDTAGGGTYRTVGNAACENGGGGGTPTPTATPTPIPTPTPAPSGDTPQYINYYAPENVADDWGEPSISVNWISGKVMFFGGINDYALRVSFNDSTSPAGTTWDQTPLVSNTAPRAVGGDPILITDKDTGRTFVSQLQ